MRVSARLVRERANRAAFDEYYRQSEQIMEEAALNATSRSAGMAQRDVRSAMKGARLGRLGNAIGRTSDLEKGRGAKRYADGGFSASGTLYVRSRSDRTLGALEAYTQGAEIRPTRGRLLWYPTPEAPKRAGREKMTPALYRKLGFEQKIGPLFELAGIGGERLLVVADVGKSAVGARGGRVRSRTRAGGLRKGDRAKQLSVLFVGIPRTSRAARVDLTAILKTNADRLPQLWREEMAKRGRR